MVLRAEIRDKGIGNLAHPDVKIAAGLDPLTGYLWILRADFDANQAQVWWQPSGWLPVVQYGNLPGLPKVNLVGFTALTHDGHFKMAGAVWDKNQENGGDLPGNSSIIIDLGAIPR